MSDTAIANPSLYDVSTLKLFVEGKEVDATYQLLSLCIIKEINHISTAKLIIRDGEAAEQKFAVSEKDDFVPGKKIMIKAGRDGNDSQFFKGIITRHAIKIRENGNSELQIEC